MKKTVIISISRGFVVRDLVISGAIGSLLKRSTEVILLTHDRHLNDLSDLVKGKDNIRVIPYPPAPTQLHFLERKLTDAGYRLHRSPSVVRLVAQLNNLFSNLLQTGYFQQLLDRYRPDLVVSGTPGFHTPVDAYLIREAKQRGIPTLSVIPSWDNLFTRGILPVFPSRLAVWNEEIKSDFVRFYGYSTERIAVVGPLQFDFYFDDSIYISRSDFFRQNGLEEGKKLVTIALSRVDLVGSPDYLLSAIERAYERGRFVKPVQFVCRLHPFDQKLSKESLQHYRFCHFEHFNQRTASFGWCPDEAEIRHKANLLKHSDVIVSYYSTFGIEGVLSGSPVIHVEFHNEKPKEFERLKTQLYERHFRYLKGAEAIRPAQSEEALIGWINRYLENPQLDAPARRTLAERFCFRLDGKAHERLAEFACRLMQNGKGSEP